MKPHQIGCRTCGFIGNRCWDQCRNDFFPYGIFHAARIKDARDASPEETKLYMNTLENELLSGSSAWRSDGCK